MDIYFTQSVTKCDQTVSLIIMHCVRAGISNRCGAGVWVLPGLGKAVARTACVGVMGN